MSEPTVPQTSDTAAMNANKNRLNFFNLNLSPWDVRPRLVSRREVGGQKR